MLPDRVSNPGPLSYESGALPIALRGPAHLLRILILSLLSDIMWQIFSEVILLIRVSPF